MYLLERRIEGLSPRGRGKQSQSLLRRRAEGSIPAWAGETGASPPRGGQSAVYPRVGGGNLLLNQAGLRDLGLSPRGRGKRVAARQLSSITWSIPAWAGETGGRPPVVQHYLVYPRVGGGNFRPQFRRRPPLGLSPRGRGKPNRRKLVKTRERSIPAWAGETRNPGAFCRSGEVYPRVGGGNYLPAGVEAVLEGLSPRGRGKRTPTVTFHISRRSIPAWAGETASSCG